MICEAVTLTALAYADGVAIPVILTEVLREFYSEAVVLKMNTARINVFYVGYESDTDPNLTLGGMTIDACDIYNYLGLPALLQGRYSPEIRLLVSHR